MVRPLVLRSLIAHVCAPSKGPHTKLYIHMHMSCIACIYAHFCNLKELTYETCTSCTDTGASYFSLFFLITIVQSKLNLELVYNVPSTNYIVASWTTGLDPKMYAPGPREAAAWICHEDSGR